MARGQILSGAYASQVRPAAAIAIPSVACYKKRLCEL